MTCTCIQTVNEKLATLNTRLTQAWKMGDSPDEGLMLETDQIEKGRGKPKAVAVFLTFCPFCGVKYGEDAA
ncbi:hypothetical protein AB9E14_23455 [Rhizobium leguminosarum]|uniref:hypothetical protein n=1 Tax=Rhizobium leguminosarum TaxID=384 RepID=UPI003F9C1E78